MLSKVRFPLMALGMLALLTVLWGELARLGWTWPVLAAACKACAPYAWRLQGCTPAGVVAQ